MMFVSKNELEIFIPSQKPRLIIFRYNGFYKRKNRGYNQCT